MEAWIIDAFADDEYRGNPAAVVPHDVAFPITETMQAVAAQLGVPTTAFVVPGTHSQYRLRWFTPQQELNICGHATIASAAYLYDVRGVSRSGDLCFHTRSGPLYARRAGRLFSVDLPRMDVSPCALDPRLEDALGAKCLRCFRAIDDLLVEVGSEETVATLRPDFDALARYECRGHIITARALRRDVDFVSRSFFPALGVNEDQVCVSAHCKLGPFWSERLHKSRLSAVQLSARGGRLLVDVRGHRVLVHGTAVVRQSVSLTTA